MPMTAPTCPFEYEAIEASIFQRLHLQVYLERFIFQNVRPDGQPLALGEIFLSMSVRSRPLARLKRVSRLKHAHRIDINCRWISSSSSRRYNHCLRRECRNSRVRARSARSWPEEGFLGESRHALEPPTYAKPASQP
ncbi:hypothetical protein FIBSPDRAFT_285778 [Athelia psychrophila]|uniref:Uncharacterized protein n=1 Tax=Athelia psychrophila TaxID=1759441 RepID=A0A166R714_9AGAM|nr:hypothetical protein FIBSPDRAFT_285778 [Fibularhizoctonia sp. CBS 109695]